MDQIKTTSNWVAAQGNTAWLDNDPRSVQAMLRGKGDGRDRLYSKFEQKALRSNPAASLDQIAEDYKAYVIAKQKGTSADSIASKLFQWAGHMVLAFTCFT